MTGPFVPQVGYSASKPIKHQILSLQASTVGGLEQAIANISLVTLHRTIMKQKRPCLFQMAPTQIYETFHVFEHWYCVECMCFGISSSGRSSSNASKAVRSSYTATHPQSRFEIWFVAPFQDSQHLSPPASGDSGMKKLGEYTAGPKKKVGGQT